MSLNMKKEIRAEIAILRRAGKKVGLDLRAEHKRINKEMALHKRQFHKLHNDWDRADKRGTKAAERIARRILILEGRLA